MHSLATINELKTNPPEVTASYVQQAGKLSDFYALFKQNDLGGYSYEVDIPGSRERAPGIHASEISHCTRQLTYSIQGVKRKPTTGGDRDINMQMRFNLGHAVHGMLQQEFSLMCTWLNSSIFGNSGWSASFCPEVRISEENSAVAKQWAVHSSCDGVFCFDFNGETVLRVGLEIKTKSGPEYEKLGKPENAHIEQTHLYMACLDLPLLWFVYYNKSNSNYTKSAAPYLVQFDSNLWDNKLVPRFAKATTSAQANQLPDRAEGMHCRWCPFAYVCAPPSVRTYGVKPDPASTSPVLWPTS